MALETEILAFHGWGFDAKAWDTWSPYLGDSCRLQAFDRGYYGATRDPVFRFANTQKVIFAHSYGLHLCPTWQLNSCDLLVIFNGFLSFHPQTPRLEKKSRLILQRMQEQFAHSPEAVIKRFMQRCYQPVRYEHCLKDAFARERLAEDLFVLGESEIAPAVLENGPRVLLLHGAEDRIVPVSQGRALCATFGRARFREIEAAGHALPFSHTGQCWAVLASALRSETRERLPGAR